MVSQLDRQLVFGAYGGMAQGAMDGIQGMNVQNLPDGMHGWDMGIPQNADLGTEPLTSAWFMPFNMPPEADQDGLFDSLAMNNAVGYGMGGMQMNHPDGSSHMDGTGRM